DVSELPEAERWLDSADAIDLGYDEALPQLVRASRIALAEEATRQRRIVRFRVAALGAIALLVIIVLGVGLWSVQRDLDNQRAFGEQQRELGQKQQEAAATSQPVAKAEATARADADARRQEAERLRLVSIAQALAVQAPRQYEQFRQSERSVLLARQAFLFNQRAQGQALDHIDESLRTVLNAPYFSYILRGPQGEVHTIVFI